MSLKTKAVRRLSASFEAVLVDAGFAALVLLKRTTSRGTGYFFASAVVDDEGCVTSYFVVAASKDVALDYFLGETDLRYVYVYANDSTYYEVDAENIFSKNIKLKPFEGEVPDDVIPDRGFFASDHNVQYNPIKLPPSTHSVPIDGHWSMSDFKEFYSKYSDIYVFHECMTQIQGKSLRNIPVQYVSAFRDKPFRGGSSYLGFFSSLKSALPRGSKPRLEAIQWASPGEITIRGSQGLFGHVETQVLMFEKSYSMAKPAYKNLREFMAANGWLDITADQYKKPSADEETLLSSLIEELVKELYIPGDRSFSHILEGNQIVEAKIFMAVFRRLETLIGYFREGRISIG